MGMMTARGPDKIKVVTATQMAVIWQGFVIFKVAEVLWDSGLPKEYR